MGDCVADASPLILLANAGRIDLLEVTTTPLLVPAGVAREIRAGGPEDAAVQLLDIPDLVCVVPSPTVSEALVAWNLGRGETEAIALARSLTKGELLIDDLLGRRCATFFGVPLRGTLGLVLVARLRGKIPAARPVVDDLVRAGMYLSPATIDTALAQIGE